MEPHCKCLLDTPSLSHHHLINWNAISFVLAVFSWFSSMSMYCTRGHEGLKFSAQIYNYHLKTNCNLIFLYVNFTALVKHITINHSNFKLPQQFLSSILFCLIHQSLRLQVWFLYWNFGPTYAFSHTTTATENLHVHYKINFLCLISFSTTALQHILVCTYIEMNPQIINNFNLWI